MTSFVSLTLGGGGYSNFTGVLGLVWCSWRWGRGGVGGGGGYSNLMAVLGTSLVPWSFEG